MTYRAFSNLAASSLIIATTMVGCSGASFQERAGKSAAKMQQMAAAQARDAEKAIARHQAARAVSIAEAAVAAAPEEAAYRVLLGRAYLMAGRYESARTAFSDALELGSADTRAIVNLALIDTALGQADRGRSVLADHIDALTAADYGLAMAMAGAPDEAIAILSQAIHDPNASARERQNLAYAYALSGRWAEARRMAAFDLSPEEAAKRVLGWARMAQPGAESRRVIAMIGVEPRADDAGLPTRLALAPAAPAETAAPVRLADAFGAAVPAPDGAPMLAPDGAQTEAEAPSATLAFAGAMPQAPAPDAAAEQNARAAQATPRADRQHGGRAVRTAPTLLAAQAAVPPMIAAPAAPVRAAIDYGPAPRGPMRHEKPVSVLKVALPAARPFVRAAAAFAPVDPAHGSSWVVQLGAFSSRQAAQASRSVFLRSHAALRAFPVIDSSVTLDGKAFYRVAVAGFGDRSGADHLCGIIKARGGSCFVRMGGAEAAPSRWAQALRRMQPQRLAMR